MDDAETWSEQQWGPVDLGDARRTRRAVALGTGMARAPGAGLPKQTAGWAGLKGAYRLLDRPEASLEAVTAPHRAAVCSAAATSDGAVLFVHDDTTIDLTRHNAMQGRGRIGNDGGFGCLAHSCLALAPTSSGTRILGLASQTAWTRRHPPAKGNETPTQRRTRRTEADIWAECIAGIGPCPPGAVWVSVGDRGADVFAQPPFWKAAWALASDCEWRGRVFCFDRFSRRTMRDKLAGCSILAKHSAITSHRIGGVHSTQPCRFGSGPARMIALSVACSPSLSHSGRPGSGRS